MTDQKLIEFVQGALSGAEHRAVIQWIEASEENRKRYHLIKARQTVSEFNTPVLDVESGYRALHDRTRGKKKILPTLLRIAATFLILITAWLVWDRLPEKSIPEHTHAPVASEEMKVAGRGENHKVTLPDGSTVLLNSDSRISWNAHFGEGNREVHLAGEAYFDV